MRKVFFLQDISYIIVFDMSKEKNKKNIKVFEKNNIDGFL